MSEKEFFTWIIGFLIVCLLYHIISCTKSLSKYFDAKKEDLKTPNTITMRVGDTIYLIDLIKYLINTQIETRVSILVLTGNPYNMLNLDKDIRDIGTTVYNSIKPEIYKEKEILVQPEYLLNYISSEVSIQLSTALKTMNLSMYSENTEE